MFNLALSTVVGVELFAASSAFRLASAGGINDVVVDVGALIGVAEEVDPSFLRLALGFFGGGNRADNPEPPEVFGRLLTGAESFKSLS